MGLPALSLAARPICLGAELRRRRMSMAVMALGVGVHIKTIERWCSGVTSPPSELRRRADAWLLSMCIDPAQAWRTQEEAHMADVTRLAPHRLHLVDEAVDSITNAPPTAEAPQEEKMPLCTTREFLSPPELAHWGLSVDPFDDDSHDPSDVYLSPAAKAVDAALWLAIKRRRIVALVAEPGAGKSTLLRRVYATAASQVRSIRLLTLASLDRQRVSHTSIAVAILRDLLGRDTGPMAQEARSDLLRLTLADQVSAGALPVLLLEEAHLLPVRALIALKQVWDSHTLYHQLAVVMVGQLPLRDRLRADPALRELAGRTQLLELPRTTDAGDYLRWRFARVGGDADRVFATDAYPALAARGEHYLWVNNLAILSMRYASQHGMRPVTAACVARAV